MTAVITTDGQVGLWKEAVIMTDGQIGLWKEAKGAQEWSGHSGDAPQPPILSWRSRDHGERSAPALAWAQPLFEFERHCILLDSCSGQTC